jgi:hypothetical protein
MSVWRVYKFTRPMTFEFLGTVEAARNDEPCARGVAMKRWPTLAKTLHLHSASASSCHCGMARLKPRSAGEDC